MTSQQHLMFFYFYFLRTLVIPELSNLIHQEEDIIELGVYTSIWNLGYK